VRRVTELLKGYRLDRKSVSAQLEVWPGGKGGLKEGGGCKKKNEKENSTRKELSIRECQAKSQCSSERYLMSGVPTATVFNYSLGYRINFSEMKTIYLNFQ
jgi:hypothetical protein